MLGVDLMRGLVSESRVETWSIITKLDVARNVCHGVSARGVHRAMNTFVLERPEERLGHSVIEADPGPPDGVPNVERSNVSANCRDV